MREPDGWWDHIPVVIETLYKVRDHEEWYGKQLRAALVGMQGSQMFKCIPATGFFVRIVAGVIDGELLCGFILRENLEGYSRYQMLADMPVVGSSIRHPLADLETDANPFL